MARGRRGMDPERVPGRGRTDAPAVDRVRKRDGRVVPFQVEKITAAIAAAMVPATCVPWSTTFGRTEG